MTKVQLLIVQQEHAAATTGIHVDITACWCVLSQKFSKLCVPMLGYTQTSHWSGISAGKNYWVECYILVSQALLLSHPLCSPASQSKSASSDNQRSADRTTHPNNPAVEALRRP